MTWKQEAASIIEKATAHIPDDAPLSVRTAAINAARPSHFRMMSWPRKAWQAARRDYLVRFGYRPRTKKQAEREAAALSDLPLFGEG